MTAYLGPLERVGDRWIIGDPKREGGSCLVLTAKGMEHHRHGAPEPVAVIPWTRFMELGVSATWRAWMTTRTMGVVDALGNGGMVSQMGGRSACSAHGLLRHPYELWSVNYTHHKRPYTSSDIFLVDQLFRKTTAAKAVHRLGDPQWLDEAVARVAALHVGWKPSAARKVKEIIEGIGT